MTTATLSTISARLERVERLVINLASSLHIHTEILMSTAQELQDAIDALTARATEAKADADRHAAATDQAVGLLQALTAKISELAAAGPQLITQAQLDALSTQAGDAIAVMDAANTTRDAADAALGQGVADNTPAP